ncbi:6-bladed beta-propeller [Longimicrobium sp.]|uniref:6-bladed beta-propeller n=1 Tax=Longimicrobium sp. TaxID=2029185 RepID=UPI002E35CA46|nr:6-bladed beta-propeller [Longimicrobium sp.]HEX6040131.1 6-bladed beta-propeller [Longimicrobium sp.]
MPGSRWIALACVGGMIAGPLASQAVVRMPVRDQALRREVREVFSVGAADGAGGDVFGAVGDVGFDAAENLYVLDRLNTRVVVFDSTGRFVRTLGRRGGGPGELTAPQQMAVSRDGEVTVSDAGRRALVVFGRGGTARSVPFPGVTMLIGRTLALHPRGGIVSVAMGNPLARDADAFGEELLLWMPAGDGAPRRLATVSTPRSRTTGGGVRVHEPLVFAPTFRFAVLPGGSVAVADDAAYSIRIQDADGRVICVLRRPFEPRRVTERDRRHERDRREGRLAGGLRLIGAEGVSMPMGVRQALAEPLEDAAFAGVMPVIRRMGVDPAGNLWVERTGPTPDRPAGIDVVSPRGRYLGTLAGWELPDAFSPGGRAAYVRENALGVQRVVVVRFRWEAAGR